MQIICLVFFFVVSSLSTQQPSKSHSYSLEGLGKLTYYLECEAGRSVAETNAYQNFAKSRCNRISRMMQTQIITRSEVLTSVTIRVLSHGMWRRLVCNIVKMLRTNLPHPSSGFYPEDGRTRFFRNVGLHDIICISATISLLRKTLLYEISYLSS
jgi:hypothetical protein